MKRAILCLIFFSAFPIFAMEAPDGHDQLSVQTVPAAFAYCSEIKNNPEALNCFTCLLVLQDQIIQKIDMLQKKSEELLAVENERRDTYAGTRDSIVISFNSYEILTLALKHKNLLSTLIIKPSSFEEVLESKRGWRHYPNIQNLIDTWLQSEHSDVVTLAQILKVNIEEDKLKSQFNKIKEELITLMSECFSGKYNYLVPFSNTVHPDLKKYINYISSTAIWLKQLQTFLKQPGFKSYQLVFDKCVPGAQIVRLYNMQKSTIESLYLHVYELLENYVRNNKGNWHYLKFKQRVLQTRQKEVMFGDKFVYEQQLPKALVQIDEKKELDQQEDSKDDWLPTQVKKIAQVKKAIAKSGKAKGRKKITPKKQKTASNSVNKLIDVDENQQSKIQPNADQIEIPQENQIVYAEDGSWLAQETEDYLEFEDPKNNLITRILKTANSEKNVTWSENQLNTIEQTNWVKQWYNNPQQAIEDQGYTDPENQKFTHPENYRKVIAYHTPALILKSYIKQLAQQEVTENRRVEGQKDTLFTMPGIEFYKDKKVTGKNWEAGIFAWIIDSADDKTNYHVEFRPTEVSKMVYDWVSKGYLEIAFPSLHEIAEYNKKI